MSRRGPRKPRPPLDEAKLNELALAYVARFATSRAKLASYLARKIRERGWAGSGDPPIAGLVEKAARAGYVDDSAYALSKARSLTGRGYGERRVAQALHAAGITEADGEPARDHARDDAVEAALRFARRRRIGPFASEPGDSSAQEKALAAMIRGGHGFLLSKAILSLPPGSEIDVEALESAR
jgi:regulatory protein